MDLNNSFFCTEFQTEKPIQPLNSFEKDKSLSQTNFFINPKNQPEEVIMPEKKNPNVTSNAGSDLSIDGNLSKPIVIEEEQQNDTRKRLHPSLNENSGYSFNHFQSDVEKNYQDGFYQPKLDHEERKSRPEKSNSKGSKSKRLKSIDVQNSMQIIEETEISEEELEPKKKVKKNILSEEDSRDSKVEERPFHSFSDPDNHPLSAIQQNQISHATSYSVTKDFPNLFIKPISKQLEANVAEEPSKISHLSFENFTSTNPGQIRNSIGINLKMKEVENAKNKGNGRSQPIEFSSILDRSSFNMNINYQQNDSAPKSNNGEVSLLQGGTIQNALLSKKHLASEINKELDFLGIEIESENDRIRENLQDLMSKISKQSLSSIHSNIGMSSAASQSSIRTFLSKLTIGSSGSQPQKSIGDLFFKEISAYKANPQKELFVEMLAKELHDEKRLLLLNNYAHSLFQEDAYSQECVENFQQIQKLLVKYISKKDFNILGRKWLTISPAMTVKIVEFDPRWLSRELFRNKFFKQVFHNLCYYKAQCFKKILINHEKESVIEELKYFASSFNKKAITNYTKIELPKNCRVITSILRFTKIILKEDSLSVLDEPLKDEIKILSSELKELYILCQDGQQELAFEKLKRFELFYIAIGIILSSDPDSNVWNMRDLILDKLEATSKVTTSVELSTIYLFGGCYSKIMEIINLQEALNAKFDKKLYNTITCLQHFLYGFRHKVDLIDINNQIWTLNSLSLKVHFKNMADFNERFKCAAELKQLERIEFAFCESCLDCLTELEASKDEDIADLMNSLIKLSLKRLRLNFSTSLSNGQIKHLTEGISSLTTLQELRLKHNKSNISPERARILEEALINLKELKKIHLTFKSCPNITKESVSSLAYTISKLPLLKDVELCFISCNIRPKEASEIRSIFKDLSLKRIIISIKPIES